MGRFLAVSAGMSTGEWGGVTLTGGSWLAIV
jgi:hypothetical protein